RKFIHSSSPKGKKEMNSLKIRVKGIILLMALTLLGCPAGFERPYDKSIQQHNHLASLSQQPDLLKQLPLPEGLSAKRVDFIWDNEHILIIQDFNGGVVLNLSTETIRHHYPFEHEIASAQLFNPERYLLLQGRGFGNIWYISNNEWRLNWDNPDTNAQATAVSEHYIFTGEYLHRFDTGQPILCTPGQYHAILTAAAISPDETLLATGGTWDDQVILWDINSGKQLDLWSMSDHVKTLAFSADNRYLYATSYRHWVAYEWATQTRVFENANPFSWWGGHYLPERDAMLIVSAAGVVQWLQAPEGKVVWRYHAGEDIIAYNAEPQADLALALKNGAIALVDMNTGNEWLRLKHDFYVDAVAISADRRFLVAGIVRHGRGELVLWQLPQSAP
ncbi:MAG: WD40 repeat domain-containing protein, partial [Pseudomonadota bacterium]|nr:WD40 repeat domain-containing protein [Pseudomonadota bacterium]